MQKNIFRKLLKSSASRLFEVFSLFFNAYYCTLLFLKSLLLCLSASELLHLFVASFHHFEFLWWHISSSSFFSAFGVASWRRRGNRFVIHSSVFRIYFKNLRGMRTCEFMKNLPSCNAENFSVSSKESPRVVCFSCCNCFKKKAFGS